MGIISNFKMPKINKNIIPTSSDFGIDTGSINSKISDIVGKFDTSTGIDLSNLPNPKDKALDILNSIPTVGNFSLMSLVPTSMLDKIDTEKITKDLNGKLGEIDLGEFGTLKLPDDIGKAAKDVISGKGFDFSSLYSMPAIETPSYDIGSEFNLDEMMSEVNTMSDIATDEFNIEEYLKEYSNITL